jgi:WD40 repeat protein
MSIHTLKAVDKQITQGHGGRILTNYGVWSPDSQWLVYDTRFDTDGSLFDGTRIEIVNIESGEVRTVYESKNGACCGVATFHPTQNRVVFILGPEHPTPDWQYDPAHRQGVLVDIAQPGIAHNLDARDLMPPLTPGALRGGSHVHIFSPDSQWVSFTYNDHLLAQFTTQTPDNDTDLRNIGVSIPVGPVTVPKTHPRNHDGTYFSVLATRTTAHPTPGSDEIQRAFEEAWVGTHGYTRADGTHQCRALAFQGEVVTAGGEVISEVFIVDLPEDVTVPSPDGPLEGTMSKRPIPPLGTTQRRLTYTAEETYPGIQGPRHWLRSSPDGSQIGFLRRDDEGIVQLWTVSPQGDLLTCNKSQDDKSHGGQPRQITRDAWPIASAFTWSPDGRLVAYIADNSVFVVEAATGLSHRLTPRSTNEDAPLPLACVFSPDGRHIAYMRRIIDNCYISDLKEDYFNQIFVVHVDELDK